MADLGVRGLGLLTRRLYYVLDGQDVRPASGDEAEDALGDVGRRRVAETRVGRARVSTVFLVVDHRYDDGRPTMIFGGPGTRRNGANASWDEAAAGHERVVAALRAGRSPLSASLDLDVTLRDGDKLDLDLDISR